VRCRGHSGGVQVSSDVPLAPLTTLGLGGPARHLVEARTEQELLDAVVAADAAAEQVLLLGGGSNLVLPDAGVAGTVVLIRTSGIRTTDAGADGSVLVSVAAGEPWEPLVVRTVTAGLAGMECLAGIPGLTGAAPVQNVGAYGQDVGLTVAEVRAYDRAEGTVRVLGAQECRFGYRHSRFKAEPGRWLVLEVTFRLRRRECSEPVRYAELARRLGIPLGGRAPLGEVADAVLDLRRAKGMVVNPGDPDTASAGSFFTNPVLSPAEFGALRERLRRLPGEGSGEMPGYGEPDGRTKVPAAWLIERAGFGKGFGAELGSGRARVSSRHTLALTNRGGATTAELLTLARTIRDGVRERLGVELVNEPVLVGDTL